MQWTIEDTFNGHSMSQHPYNLGINVTGNYAYKYRPKLPQGQTYGTDNWDKNMLYIANESYLPGSTKSSLEIKNISILQQVIPDSSSKNTPFFGSQILSYAGSKYTDPTAKVVPITDKILSSLPIPVFSDIYGYAKDIKEIVLKSDYEPISTSNMYYTPGWINYMNSLESLGYKIEGGRYIPRVQDRLFTVTEKDFVLKNAGDHYYTVNGLKLVRLNNEDIVKVDYNDPKDSMKIRALIAQGYAEDGRVLAEKY